MPPPRFVAHALSPSLRIDVWRARSRHVPCAKANQTGLPDGMRETSGRTRPTGLTLLFVRSGQARAEPNRNPGPGLQSRQEAQRICLVGVESQCRIPDQIQRDIRFLPPAYGLPLSLESTCPAYPAPGSGRRLSDGRNSSRATTRSKANQPGVGPRHCLRPCPILLLLCMTILFLL